MKPEHASVAMETYLDDLEKYDSLLVEAACQRWRTMPGNKFFPAIGELMAFLVPAQKLQDEHAQATPRETRQLPRADMRYTGKYVGWESMTDDEKCRIIAADIHEIEGKGDPMSVAKMGKAFLAKAGWNTA